MNSTGDIECIGGSDRAVTEQRQNWIWIRIADEALQWNLIRNRLVTLLRSGGRQLGHE